VTFDLLHEILFWPLELSANENLGLYFLNRWADKVIQDNKTAWRDLDPFDRGTTDSAELRYAEFVYFHPFVRRFLYPDSGMETARLRILKRDDIHRVRVKLSGVTDEETLEVDRVHLYLFHTQIAILVVEVKAARKVERRAALQFLDQFRRVYAPYWFNGKGGHCPEKVEWLDQHGLPIGTPSNFESFNEHRQNVEKKEWRRPPVAAHWRWLIEGLEPSNPMSKDGTLYFDQIEDDRMMVMSFLGHPEPHSLSDQDMTRLCFLDEASDSPQDWPYSPQFLADFQKHCYDRYWDKKHNENSWMTTRYLCCGYAFTVLGCSKAQFVTDEWSGLLSHFRHHYFQLGLLAHFHRASLLRFSRRFADSVGQRESTLNHEFADFVAGYWFNEVSNQVQGQELFQFWSNHLGNQRLLHHVLEEKRLAVELEEALQIQGDGRQVKLLTKRLTSLTYLLLPLTASAALVAYLDMDFTREHLQSWKEGSFWLVLPLVLILLILVCYLFTWRRRESVSNEEVENARKG